MGAFEYEQQTSVQVPWNSWDNGKSWMQEIHQSEQQSATLATVTEGLTTYRHIGDKDSGYSSDDACSNADSVFDTSSVVSSQSSYSSASSDDSDDAFEGHEVSYSKQPADINATGLNNRKQFDEQAELLSGLRSHHSATAFRPQDQPSCSSNASHWIPRSQPTFTQPGKFNRRRSGSHGSANGPPCQLKRDTETSDCFVAFLITFAARLITAIWPLSASPPMMSSCFNGAGVLPLEVFIHETLRRSKTSYSTLQVALFYIILLKDKLSGHDFTKEQPKSEDSQQSSGPSTCRAMQCGRRMFLAALMLASKYLQDRNYSTRAWSKISGLRIPEINENETEYLRSIDYRLHMKRDAFENWSKIVLTLSKLSKLRPGCHSRLASLRSTGPEVDTILASMVPGSTPYAKDSVHAVYSNSWWCALVKKLEPELVNDASRTDDFLKENIPLDDVAEILTRPDNALPTPPTSPEASPPYVPDMTFNQTFPSGNGLTPTLPKPTELRAPSPARSSVLPLRPQLQNLPTPQSTPCGTDPWHTITHNNQQKSLRCSASVDALRAMRKQCFSNANLERCPPPRPHSLALPPGRSLMRPAESTQARYGGSVTPAVLSPADSVLTASTPRTCRSRSSSISSNSSWSSWAAGPPRSLQTQFQSQTSSPLARVVSAPEAPIKSSASSGPIHPLRRKANFASNAINEGSNDSPVVATNSHSEGYSTCNRTARLPYRSSQAGVEADAIQALLTMRTANAQESYICSTSTQTTPTLRGHKRTISKTNDSLQDHVSHLLKSQCINDDVMDDLTPTPTPAPSESNRQWQRPSKLWAMSKRPAPNAMDTKRMAVYCAMHESTAPELASQYLKDHMVTV